MKSLQCAFMIFVLGFAASVAPACAQDVSALEKRLEALEQEVKWLRSQLDAKNAAEPKEASASSAPLVSVQPAGKEESLKVGGLIHAQADFGDRGDSRFSTNNDRFYLRRARLNVSGKFQEDFDFKAELDLAGTLTETSALRAQMTDAYINWNKLSYANIRTGQLKTPFGYEQLAKDPNLYTIERSLANDRLTLGRQIGVQLHGDLIDKRLSYATGLFNGNGANNNFNDDDGFTYVGRLSGVPWQGKLWGMDSSWSVGGNGYGSHDSSVTGLNDFGFIGNTFNGKRWGAGADTQLHVDRLDLWAEYLLAEYSPVSNVPSPEVDADGWYAQAAYFVVPKKLQGVLRYEYFDPNTDVDDTDTGTWVLGTNYYIKGEDLKLQLHYLRSDANGESEEQDKILIRLQTLF